LDRPLAAAMLAAAALMLLLVAFKGLTVRRLGGTT
jgi:hypothetical protein